MSMSSPTPPTPMNPATVANQQQQYNIDSAAAGQAASAVNQTTPYGSLSYTQTGTGPGGIPLYTASSKLSPQQQQILDTLQGQTSNLLGGANYGNADPASIVGNSTSGLTKDLLDKNMSYIRPYYDMDKSQLDTKLRNQGFAPGEPGYDNAMRGLLDSQNRTTQQFEATIEPQAYQQATSNYLLPLTMSGSEFSLMDPTRAKASLVPTPTTSVNPADYSGAVKTYQDALNTQYAQQLQQSSAAMSGMFGIPTAVLGGWARSGFAGAGGLGSMFGGGAGSGASGLGSLAGAALI